MSVPPQTEAEDHTTRKFDSRGQVDGKRATVSFATGDSSISEIATTRSIGFQRPIRCVASAASGFVRPPGSRLLCKGDGAWGGKRLLFTQCDSRIDPRRS